jgi:hypothetical protein
MGFKYALVLADGEDAGEAEYGYQLRPGDEIYLDDTRRARVTAVIPVERAAEFVDDATYGLLEIEPLP